MRYASQKRDIPSIWNYDFNNITGNLKQDRINSSGNNVTESLPMMISTAVTYRVRILSR
jgi:hypothetical protein